MYLFRNILVTFIYRNLHHATEVKTMKNLHYILTAGLICGTAMFTACSDDSSSPASEKDQVSENHAAFVENTRAQMKVLAEDINLSSWEYANSFNTHLNEFVLLNEDFEQSIVVTAALSILQSLTDVEKDSELDKLGYEQYFTIDFSQFKYQFTMKEDVSGFDVKPADNFSMIISGYNTETHKVEKEMFKVSLDVDGVAGKARVTKTDFNLNKMAIVVNVPKNVSFDLSTKVNDKWSPLFTGKFTNTVKSTEGSEFLDNLNSTFDIEGEIKSSVPNTAANSKTETDNTTIKFKASQDAKKNQGSLDFTYVHNDKEILSVSGVLTNDNGEVDLDNFTTSNSIIDIISTMLIGDKIDDLKITILDDMIINIKVSDCEEFVKVHRASKDARRNYADEETVKQYVDAMNKVMTMTIESKATKQKMDIKFEAAKFGVDYITMPTIKFADADNYVSMLEVLDPETMILALNIVDKISAPLSESILTVRQLIQYFRGLTGTYEENQGTAL